MSYMRETNRNLHSYAIWIFETIMVPSSKNKAEFVWTPQSPWILKDSSYNNWQKILVDNLQIYSQTFQNRIKVIV